MQHLWGSSEVVFEDTSTERGIIVVRAHAVGGNGASSIHHHKRHFNTLLVLSGTMLLDLCDSNGHVLRAEFMEPGRQVILDPETNHRLRFPEPVELLEYYVAEPGQVATLDDIFRISEGAKPAA